MSRDELMRRALGFSAIYNSAAAILFAFPSSAPAHIAGLPPAVPGLYRVLLGFFVLLFGGAYAWLALQPDIDRPLVAFAALGKTGAFGIILALWLVGGSPGRGVLAASGDLVLAGIFAWWLFGDQQAPPAAASTAAR
jgi:hypothetical protein